MKKIKNIRQLQRERKQLRQREKELMQQMKSGWREIKKLLRPCNFVKEQTRRYNDGQFERKDNGIFKTALSFATTLLIQKLKKKTEQFFR